MQEKLEKTSLWAVWAEQHFLKLNYFKKQQKLVLTFPLQKIKYRFKLAWSTQQASSMHLRHVTSLLVPVFFDLCNGFLKPV